MEKKNIKIEMGCNLFIDTEEQNPSIITELTGMEASEVDVKGAPFVTPSGKVIPQKVNEYNLWVLKPQKELVSEEENIYLEEAVKKTLSILDQQKSKFVEVLKKFPKSRLLCYCYYFGEYNPYFFFSRELIQRLNEYNLQVEFDLYFLEAKE